MPLPSETTVVDRVLIVDDNRAIHADFAKILAHPAAPAADALAAFEATLFGAPPTAAAAPAIQLALASAYQGDEATALVADARAAGRPYALAFVDMRMPPGMDGLDTIEAIWQVDPDVQIIICSAYSDRSWGEIRDRLGERDGLLILKKPFDPIEVLQAAHAMTAKWRLAAAARRHVIDLEAAVRTRTAELEATAKRLAAELAHRDRMETELRLAHKLEAVGQLAAGVAHEINTPLQYLGDNLAFIREVTTGLAAACAAIRAAAAQAADPLLVADLDVIADNHELDYLTREVGGALEGAEQGVARITTIVRAMRELSHPGERAATPADLNRVIGNALEVSASSYRYVAELRTDLAPLPLVTCFASDLTQVLLNLIVNAAQAMEERPAAGRGTLTVTSRVDGDHVVIGVADTGGGIPDHVRDRIFDAFFTTKAVGRGTGQGLSIARAMIVERHGGTLTFDTVVGHGTTFHVRLPIGGPPVRAARLSGGFAPLPRAPS